MEAWKANRQAELFKSSIKEMFSKDTYGGKTPEETFNLFVEAIKSENVDLAVKYIVLDIERRQRYYDEFSKMKAEGKLKEYGENIPKWEEWEKTKDSYSDWESRAEIVYSQIVKEKTTVYDPNLQKDTVISPGVWGRSIIFVKNQNNIWKIESF